MAVYGASEVIGSLRGKDDPLVDFSRSELADADLNGILPNLRRRYDLMASFPEGLVVVGDANTSLNPLYAQGMSHGAIGASILDACLTEQRATVG